MADKFAARLGPFHLFALTYATFAATSDGPHILINHADAALYRAKRAGRNRVSLAEFKVSMAS